MKGEIYPELDKIKTEIQTLKILVLKGKTIPKQKVSLKGVIRTKIDESDIEKAKASLFKMSV
ncbi:MAG: hypothetical protein HYW23_01780 [Candidatus Aenigmarchaeota archaeon]|nr:hypothetical protein [Candidatus Aenigmarchaeota archaeon]